MIYSNLGEYTAVYVELYFGGPVLEFDFIKQDPLWIHAGSKNLHVYVAADLSGYNMSNFNKYHLQLPDNYTLPHVPLHTVAVSYNNFVMQNLRTTLAVVVQMK